MQAYVHMHTNTNHLMSGFISITLVNNPLQKCLIIQIVFDNVLPLLKKVNFSFVIMRLFFTLYTLS